MIARQLVVTTTASRHDTAMLPTFRRYRTGIELVLMRRRMLCTMVFRHVVVSAKSRIEGSNIAARKGFEPTQH